MMTRIEMESLTSNKNSLREIAVYLKEIAGELKRMNDLKENELANKNQNKSTE